MIECEPTPASFRQVAGHNDDRWVEPAMNRRKFLSHALSATAVCGLSTRATADDAPSTSLNGDVGPLIDTHVYLGHWPHARLACEEPRELVELLRRNNVTHAWVGSFDGLFHKDIAAVNARLAESCSIHGDGMMLPFGSVNPTLPDWEDDLRRCHEAHRMPGIRLHPTYHGYTLADPRFAHLLTLTAKAKLVVQIVTWLDDTKHRWLTPLAANAEARPPSFSGVEDKRSLPANQPRLIISGARAVDIPVWNAAFSATNAHFDFSRISPSNRQTLAEAFRLSDRIVFGSRAPLSSIESARSILADNEIADDRRQAIERELAGQIISQR